MAGGVAISPSNGKEYPGKLTLHVFKTCIVAAMGGLIFGYDLGISGGVTSMAPFLKEFFPPVYRKEELNVGSPNQYCKFDSEVLTLFTSSLYLAALVASLFASPITRKLGRRFTMVMGGILFLFGALINAGAINVAMLIVGRMFLGFGIGCANQSVPIYLSEMAPYKYRGTLNIGFQLMITIGILIANALNYGFSHISGGWGWRLSLGGAAVPAIIITIGALWLPDTPNSLIERGKHEEAKQQLIKIRGIENVDMEFDDLIAASEASKKVAHPWGNIGKRKYRPQLTFAILIPFFQQLTGNNVITFYAPVLFKTVGFGSTASLMSSLITGAVNCGATLVAIYLADKAGRRKLFMEGGCQMLLCQIVITCCIAYKFGFDGNPGEISKSFAYLVVVFICIYVSAFAWSWGPLGWLVPSEIFPLEIRSAAQSINVCTNMFFTFVIAQVFTAMLCHMKFFLFVFFACFVIIMTIFIYMMLPETKGIPIEEMDQVWKSHWYWKRFTVVEDDTKEIQITNAADQVPKEI